jgi:hippurate hydrolase
LAAYLKKLDLEVTGAGSGIKAVLRGSRPGPVIGLRADMDALPITESGGLPFASRQPGQMHACGHDVHMTAWIGAAATLARNRKTWGGTLIMVGQPAEEVGGGASAMIADGLFTRFPKPDVALAIHDNDVLPAGTVGIKAGPLLASSDSVDIVVHGKGGHGARPNNTIDPIVLAAKIVLNLQTLVSRENDPFDPAVVTVGSIHGGTKHNIIPDEVRMQLTVRAYKDEVRERLLRGIERIARAEALAANAPKPPDVRVSDGTPVTVNDAALAARVGAALRKSLGEARVREAVPITAAEDFSRFAEPGVPILMMWVGAVNPETLERARRDGTMLPGLHSSLFAPDARPTIMTGVEALVTAAREVLGKAR